MWFYNGTEINVLPVGVVGFVYLITNLTNNRKYIGKKLAKFSKTKTKTVILKNGTKKKKKIKTSVDSDWVTYYGSSLELLSDVETLGVDAFKREILHFCPSKSACSYLEAKEQFLRNVLETPDYYNNNIMIRVHGSHILSKSLSI